MDEKRLQQLKVENPGILTYMPDELLASHGIINEARPEDELAEPPAAFSPVNESDQPESTKPKPNKKLKGKARVEPSSLDAVATTTEVPLLPSGHRSKQQQEGPHVAIPEDKSRQASMEQRLYEARRRILCNASEALGALGEEMIPTTSGPPAPF